MQIASSTLLALWLFYVGFASSISVYRLWIKGDLNLLNKILFAPLLVAFFLLDVLLNYTVLLALGLPPIKCWTMSDRFQVYQYNANLDGSRYSATDMQKAVGTWICEKLLNPIDPTGNHC